MSEDQAAQSEEAEESPVLDASLKVDPKSLGDEEVDFATALGFGEDPEPAPTEKAEPPSVDLDAEDDGDSDDDAPSPTESEDGSPEPVAADDDAPPDAADASADDTRADSTDDAEDDSETTAATTPPMDAASVDEDWEEIPPRPAAEGIQDLLEARADEVMAREAAGGSAPARTPPGSDSDALIALEDELDELRVQLAETERHVAERDAELERLSAAAAAAPADASPEQDKKLEALRSELETLSIERDQLIDQLAATSGQLVQAQRSNEQLQTSLRAARAALTPLPEGERALRAEVIGLRGRLEEARQENLRQASEMASVATDLAIATARVEDRQHEIDYHTDRVAEIERQLVEKEQQAEAAIAQHREVLALSARLQADNNELRSTQVALEETLQARDLEIAAREDHLRVTREGLTTRDTQLIDVNERLEQEKRRAEALEADLERAEVERAVMIDKVARREARIATLTETLSRIEEVMGRPLAGAEASTPPLPRAEWTRPSGSTSTPAERPDAPEKAATKATAPVSEAPSLPELESAPAAGPEPERPVEPDPERSAAPEPPVVAEIDEPTEATPVAEIETTTEARSHEAVEPPEPTREELEAATEPVPFTPPAEAELPISRQASDEPISTSQTEPESEPEPDAADEDGPGRVLIRPLGLPPIMSRYRDRRFGELAALHDTTEAETLADFQAELLARHLGPEADALRIVSVGGGLCDAEIRLVQALNARSVPGIEVEVLEADEEIAAARRQRIELAGVGAQIDVVVGDLDDWDPEAPCEAILLSDALYGQPALDRILDHIAPAMERGAMLLFVGRVGDGPIQLSASTLMRLEELWEVLPESLAEIEGLSRPPFRGDDGGHPSTGMDVGSALLARFAPVALGAFGHLADLVVGPARGFGLDDQSDEGRQLLDSILAIDESRALTEGLTPRHGFAAFTSRAEGRPEVIGDPWPVAGGG